MAETHLGTALVTGASTGIGAVYADRLAKRGYDLVLVARDEARLKANAERIGGATGRRVEVLPADLSDPAAVARVAARVAADDVTLLVNNAGIALNGGTLDNDADALARLVAVNVTAPTLLARAAGVAFKARKAGAIVNIASVLALAPERFNGAYSASKSFLLSLSLGLRGELAESGVAVQAVLPGATRTEIWQRSGIDVDGFPAEMVMDVDHLVDAALVGFDRGEAVTIPPLADDSFYTAYDEARLAFAQVMSRSEVAPRYRETVDA
jgi:uncharacterized protein